MPGCALYAYDQYGIWRLSFSTIVGSIGSNCIMSGFQDTCRVSFCNIYDNHMSPDDAIIILCGYEGLIDSCIFSDNTRIFDIDYISIGYGFYVSNCVFSDLPQNDAFVYYSTNNLFETVTASHYLPRVNICYPSHEFSQSGVFPRTDAFSASGEFTLAVVVHSYSYSYGKFLWTTWFLTFPCF
jgi:hypothetical protein